MSNYLIIVSDRAGSETVLRWLSNLGAYVGDDYVTHDLPNGGVLTHIAENASGDYLSDLGELFRGYGISHENESVYFGGDGYAQQLRATYGSSSGSPEVRNEGCFVRLRSTATSVIIDRDLFGLCPVLYTHGRGMLAVSDSMFALAKFRRDFNLSRSLNRQAILPRAWTNAMGGQLLNERTVVREIDYLPINGRLEYRPAAESLSVRREPIDKLFPAHDGSYAEALRDAGRRIAGVISALALASPRGVRLSLSGGLDSRVCLAAALLASDLEDKIEFTSQNRTEAQQQDYAIVQHLAERHRFPLGRRQPYPKTRADKRLSGAGLWFLSSVGIYDFPVLAGSSNPVDSPVVIGGHGAEVYKGNYGWRRLRSIARLIPDPRVSEAFLEEATDAIVALGIDADDLSGSEWHYLAYRNSIHGGRFVQSSMLGARPLMIGPLVSLSRSLVNPHPSPGKNSPSLVSDLLMILGPELADTPFAGAGRTLSDQLTPDRAAKLGGPLYPTDVKPYRTFGAPAAAQSGPSSLIAKLGAAWTSRIDVPEERGAIIASVSKRYLDSRLRETYSDVLPVAIRSARTLPSSREGAAVGKLLQFVMLDKEL